MDIQINNLNLSLIEADIQRLFAPYGEISSVEIIRDKLNNRSSGRALIKMPVTKQAQKALASLQGSLLGGKSISMNEVPGTDETPKDNSIFSK